MGKTWNEIVKEAYNNGILLDGCGLDSRYYWNGNYQDFCGFDVLKERCQCGYDTEWPKENGGTGDTGSTSAITYDLYAGEVDYSAYTTSEKIVSSAVTTLNKITEKETDLKNGSVTYSFELTPIPIEGLNAKTDEQLTTLKQQYAKDYVIALPQSAGTVTLKNVGGDDTANWKTTTQDINGVAYTVYSRISVDEQQILYDSTKTNPVITSTNYNIILK